MMKHLLILAVLVVATQAFGKWKQGLSVRYDVGLGVGRDFFIPMPQTMREAKNSRWVQTPRPPNQPRASLIMMNPSRDDVAVGTLYDSHGDVAGLQVAIPQDTFTGFPYSWEGQGWTNWTAPANSKGVKRNYWVQAVYFVSEETLAKSQEEREASRNGRVLQEDHVYVTGINREIMPISTVASDVADTATSGFYRQNCVTFMGRHYYYNMTTKTECTTEGIYPWFTLLDQASDANQLIGVGITTFGKLPKEKLVRDYFERPPRSQVEYVIPNAPECVYDSTENIGSLTIHIYFIDQPLLINCFFT